MRLESLVDIVVLFQNVDSEEGLTVKNNKVPTTTSLATSFAIRVENWSAHVLLTAMLYCTVVALIS